MGKKVLVVDDFLEWRKVIRSILESIPQLMVIGEACDGTEAVSLTQRLRPDVVTLDVGLPRLNGIEAARRIFEVSPQTKILFVSQDADPSVILAALDTGASGYLLKQEVGSDLLRAVANILQGSVFLSAGLSCDRLDVYCRAGAELSASST
jgi:DNA-binding NarL/FixJ family response regulator